MKFHYVSHYIWFLFFRLSFENIEFNYSFLNIFNIFGYLFPSTKRVCGGCENVPFMYDNDKSIPHPFIIYISPLFLFTFMWKIIIDIVWTPWVIFYCVIVTSPPCSCVVIQYITDIVTIIHIITDMILDQEQNINHFIISTLKDTKYCDGREIFIWFFSVFVFYTIILWSLKEYSELHSWVFYWLVFFKLVLTDFPPNLEQCSQTTSLSSVFS